MRKNSPFLALLALILIFSGTAYGQGGIVLVLSGGGTRGLAHIGVLEAIQEENIPIAGIVGASMGAIIGGLAASGYTCQEIREVIATLDLTNLLSEKTNPIFVPLSQESANPRSKIPWVVMNKTGDVIGPLGGMSGVKLLEKFAQLASRTQIVRFDELAIPFAAVATDLETGEKVVLRTGSLASAMRASMAIPVLFDPWPVGGRLLVDGGLVSNLPVDTAKDIFPGYPVIAVDVTGMLKSRKDIKSVVDVLDQSLTIFTRRNVENEILKADLVISPSVQGIQIFDLTNAGDIIDAGKKATIDRMAVIKKLAASAPPVAQQESLCLTSKVVSVVVEGATEDFADYITRKYSSWIGKPLSTLNIIRASREISEQEDVQAVDYRFEEAGENLNVVFVVQRKPTLEINFGGYTTNLHPHRWVYINGVRRDLFSEGDSLRFNLKVGEQWGMDASYLNHSEKRRAWEVTLSAQNWEMETANAGTKSWDRYAVGLTRRFSVGSFEGGLGYAFERVHSGGLDTNASGATFFLSSNTLNDPTDPTEGSLFQLQGWWPDQEEVLYRATYFAASRLSDSWRFYFRTGFAEGDERGDGRRAVFLGAAEELYSYSGNPIQGERMFWWNAAFRKVLTKSWWGALNTEIFGGMGFVYNDQGDRFRDAWEAGVSFSVPGLLFDGKLMVLYNDERDLKVGFFIGSPVWGHYPLP